MTQNEPKFSGYINILTRDLKVVEVKRDTFWDILDLESILIILRFEEILKIMEKFKLLDVITEDFIIETEDEVYYDAYKESDENKELFLKNFKVQLIESEWKEVTSTEWTVEELINEFDEDPNGYHIADCLATAGYCVKYGIELNDDSRVCVDSQLYYFNCDCPHMHYEFETDIDFG